MNKFSLQSPHVSRIATLIAAVLLGLSGARAVNIWLQVNTDTSLPDSRSISQHQATYTNKRADYGVLVKLHLLGEVEKVATEMPKQQEIIKAPETNLNLELIGILFDREHKDSYAIISDSGKPQKTFHKGDKLPGNATLFAIEHNRIILIRNGRHETLTLIKPDLHTSDSSIDNERSPNIPIQAWRRTQKIENQSLPAAPQGTFRKTERTF